MHCSMDKCAKLNNKFYQNCENAGYKFCSESTQNESLAARLGKSVNLTSANLK